ncbi:MAG: RelA/SpoT domain-containing protein [Prochlorococcaceae cyanobacterium]
MYEREDQRIADNLKAEIEAELSRAGLLFRVFARAKSHNSIQSKLSAKNYGSGVRDRKMQDLYGVRVALYFPDDSELAQTLLKSKYEHDIISSTVDTPEDATFGPTRCNLIFRLPDATTRYSVLLKEEPRIDRTFEVQFRTVFSEGWHEIEHDLRYKCKDDWQPHKDLNRAMNGFIATLETCDWAIVQLFEELAWRHYRSQEWLAMLRAKFRLRWQDSILSEGIQEAFSEDRDLAKSIFRVDRKQLLQEMVASRIDLPITPSNIVFICNHFFVNSPALDALVPLPVAEELRNQQV